KDVILNNIKQATSYKRNNLIQKIRQYKHDSHLPLTLQNFCEFYHIPVQVIYKRDNWTRLCVDAGIMDDFSDPNEKELSSSFKNKIIGNNSMSYLLFIKQLLSENINLDSLTAVEERMMLMFHYDLWQKAGGELGINTFADSMNKLQQNAILILELKELINYLIEQVDIIEKPLELDFSFPLKLYSRYNRDQILVAMEQHSLEKASSNREGVAVNKRRNSEALFI